MITAWCAAAFGAFSRMRLTLTVVGEAGDGEEAVRLRQLRPHVIVMDCALPGISGLDATRRILQNPKPRS